MKKKYYIYCDMDGVLADFDSEPNALDRFKVEKGFFARLKPIIRNVNALNDLLKNKNCKVRIITASPNRQADLDKIAWCKQYLPNLNKKDILVCRIGDNKITRMKTKEGILFDDYGKNIEQWLQHKGNRAFKITKEKGIADHIIV